MYGSSFHDSWSVAWEFIAAHFEFGNSLQCSEFLGVFAARRLWIWQIHCRVLSCLESSLVVCEREAFAYSGFGEIVRFIHKKERRVRKLLSSGNSLL